MTKPIDIAAFGELIDDYQCSQIDGTLDERANARSALMDAYRAALASSDAQADGGKSEAVAWMTPSDWRTEPLATCDKSVASAWRADNRQVTPLYDSPQSECAPRSRDLLQNVRIDTYAIPISKTDDIRIERAHQIDGADLWKVKHGSNCLSKSGEWEYEPMPSSRDDEFLARCRFATAAEAIDAAIEQAAKEPK